MKKLYKMFVIFAIVLLNINAYANTELPTDNLIKNGDAEMGDMTGWILNDDLWYPVTDEGSAYKPNNGNYFFWPSKGANNYTYIYQDIDISEYYNNGNLYFLLSGYLRNWDQYPHDQATLSVSILDSEGNTLKHIQTSQRNPQWNYHSITDYLPYNATTLRVFCEATRFVGSDNDGYFDDMKLILTNEYQNKVSIINNSPNNSFKVGDTLELSGYTTEGIEEEYKWYSSFPAIAEVDENGLVSFKQEGNVTIFVQGLTSNSTASINFKVTSNNSIIILNPSTSETLYSGGNYNIILEKKGEVSAQEAYIYLSKDSGSTFDSEPILTITDLGSSTHNISIPMVDKLQTQCVFKIELYNYYDNEYIKTLSDVFTISPNNNENNYDGYDDYDDYNNYERNDNIQLTDMNIISTNDLVEFIMGNGIEISNIKYTGTNNSAGKFVANDSNVIGFTEGIVLSSGDIHNIPGPNQESGITKENGLSGDGQLDKLIPGYFTQDATVLEFDFIPKENMMTFQYVFSSDEYNEFVGTDFNDVFGFFMNGHNLALIPNTSDVVSINNVNNGYSDYFDYGEGYSDIPDQYKEYMDEYSDTVDEYNDKEYSHKYNTENAEYFRNNTDKSIDIEMDGLTTVLTVSAPVIPNQINTIKLAIADAGDSVLDSNVFIKSGSFSSVESALIEFEDYNTYINENAGTVEITVKRSGNISEEVSIDYVVESGTAIVGEDFASELNGNLIFQPNVTTQIISIPIVDDASLEDDETININLVNNSGNSFISSFKRKFKIIIEDNDAVDSIENIEDTLDDNVDNEKASTQTTATKPNWDEMKNVPINKNFRIDFTKTIDASCVISNNFFVTDENGSLISEITPEISSDKYSVIMKTNNYTYQNSMNYYLNISTNVKTETGVYLKKPIQMKFTISDLN